MNERIKELALQAMTYVTHNPKANKLNSGDMFDEKFAELIVQECIELCAKEHAHSIHTHAGPWNTAIKRCKESIATHFGVEL